MKLIQFYKIIILFFNIVMIYGEIHTPIDIEKEISLIIKNKNLTYHKLDDSGLKYVYLGSEDASGDSIKVAIYSRVVMSPKLSKSKKFGFSVQLNNNLPFELSYKKGNTDIKSVERPGWTYSQNGIWYLYLPMKEDGHEIKIMPLNKKQNIYIRIKSNVIKRKGKFSKILKSVNEEEKIKIKTIKKGENSKKVTTSWYSLETEKQFQIQGPTKLRVFSRVIMTNELNDDYLIYVKEDGFDLGTFYFTTEISDKSIVSNSNESVSKWRSTWLSVPEGNHYYSFILPNLEQNNNEVLIRVKEWKKD